MSREPHTLGAKPLLVLVARIDLGLLLPAPDFILVWWEDSSIWPCPEDM